MLKSESFIEQRIIWNAGRHNLPAGNCFEFDQLISSDPSHLSIIESNHLGKPILAFLHDKDNWSVLGTKGISGRLEKDYRAVEYAEILDLNGFEPLRLKQTEKKNLSILKVKTIKSEIEFKTKEGGEFFAFWNIALMLFRMSSK